MEEKETEYVVEITTKLVFNVLPITEPMVKVMVTSMLRDGVNNIDSIAAQVMHQLSKQGIQVEGEQDAGSK